MSTSIQSRNDPAGDVSEKARVSPPTAGRGEATVISAWVAKGPRQPMVLEAVDLGPLGDEDVEVEVDHCGVCHSDVSVLNDEWGISRYPAILGHEVVGRVTAIGSDAKGLELGRRVGIGWNSGCDLSCRECISGNHHLCPRAEATIIGHRGGFATRVRAQWPWVFPLPDGLRAAEAGPLLCGGVTVFSPLYRYARPTDRVGILGIGGLGHMAVKFAAAYGCEVTAFTASESKFEEAKGFGAHHALTTKDSEGMKRLAGSFDLLISTVNAKLDWDPIIGMLAPNGRLHDLGVVLDPIPVSAFSLISKQRSISGSPAGSPAMIATMLDFAARHRIEPETEHFPMSQINDAFARLASGKARYRIVLDRDVPSPGHA